MESPSNNSRNHSTDAKNKLAIPMERGMCLKAGFVVSTPQMSEAMYYVLRPWHLDSPRRIRSKVVRGAQRRLATAGVHPLCDCRPVHGGTDKMLL